MSNLQMVHTYINDSVVMEEAITYKRYDIKFGVYGGNKCAGGGGRTEGNVPHIHIFRSNAENVEASPCIKIGEGELYDHGRHKQELPMSGKEIDKFLRKPYKGKKVKYEGMTNWEFLATYWNENSSIKVDISKGQPDYTKLK